MTMTMATQDMMSAWFWMTNSWLSMGKFLLAAAFLPLIGAIFDTALSSWTVKGGLATYGDGTVDANASADGAVSTTVGGRV